VIWSECDWRGLSKYTGTKAISKNPELQIANVVMPSEEEHAERREIDAKLDAIARRLMESCEPKP
jgi:hypothetical protein